MSAVRWKCRTAALTIRPYFRDRDKDSDVQHVVEDAAGGHQNRGHVVEDEPSGRLPTWPDTNRNPFTATQRVQQKSAA